jgi:hypothetical protein
MTFQAYLDNIEKQTGVGPDEFIRLATAKGFTKPGTKATQITDWLKADYGLGARPRHGHREAAEGSGRAEIVAAILKRRRDGPTSSP